MTTVLGIGIGSPGAIVEGRLIDALDMPCRNDGPLGAALALVAAATP